LHNAVGAAPDQSRVECSVAGGADYHQVGPDLLGKIDDHPCRVAAPHHSA